MEKSHKLYVVFIASYWVSSGICRIIDGRVKSGPVLDQYKKIFPTVFINTIIYGYVFFLLYGRFINIRGRSFGGIGKRLVGELLVLTLGSDILFYVGHRTLHNRALYEWSHHKHHRLVNPVGLGALYSHWFDFVLTHSSAYITPVIISSPLEVIMIWSTLVNTLGVFLAHGGYWVGSWSHDQHHKLLKCNYGANILMDYLFGTYK